MATTPGSWSYTVPQINPSNYGQPLNASHWTYQNTPSSLVPGVAPNIIPGGTVAYSDPWGRSAGFSPSISGPLFNMSNPTTWTNSALVTPVANYLSNWYYPQQQLQQNAYQWAQEYDEAMRRYNMEYDMTNAANQWRMGLEGRQQEMSEWEAQQAANQWAQQFEWTQTTDEWSRQLAQAQLDYERQQALAQTARIQALTPAEVAQTQAQAAYQQAQAANIPLEYALKARETTLAEQEQQAMAAYRLQQLAQQYQLALLEQQTALQAANTAAFGRAQRPNVRYMRNWG